MISYEFPLNERTRTLLRLEDLYAKLLCFTERSSPIDHHAALGVLFEVLEVASRSDLKSDLLQELERQKRQLAAFHNNPEISESALYSVLDAIENASNSVFNMQGKFGQHLRENEWLMSIKQRIGIPGGTCKFDLPSYHHWLHQDATLRRNYLMDCLTPLLPIRDGLAIILNLLRESGKTHHYIARHGAFQQMQCGRVAQMLRVTLDIKLPCVPEVSANKYMLNIRFLAADYVAKSAIYDEDIEFNLTFCSL